MKINSIKRYIAEVFIDKGLHYQYMSSKKGANEREEMEKEEAKKDGKTRKTPINKGYLGVNVRS
jgi:hypothetical protein